MKKLMIAMAAVAMTASMAFAQTNNTKDCPKKDCPKTEQCAKDGKKCDKPCDKQRACEFEGLNLTDTQKEQLKAIKAEQKAKFQSERQAKQAQKAAKKEEAPKKRVRKRAKKEEAETAETPATEDKE